MSKLFTVYEKFCKRAWFRNWLPFRHHICSSVEPPHISNTQSMSRESHWSTERYRFDPRLRLGKIIWRAELGKRSHIRWTIKVHIPIRSNHLFSRGVILIPPFHSISLSPAAQRTAPLLAKLTPEKKNGKPGEGGVVSALAGIAAVVALTTPLAMEEQEPLTEFQIKRRTVGLVIIFWLIKGPVQYA